MENSGKGRTIRTIQFGEFEVSENHIFYFENGVLGFEELREFVLISEEETAPFKWLISIDVPDIGFPCLSPWHVDFTYNPGKEFDLENEVMLTIITLDDGNGRMTANLKAPIVLDVKQQKGKQVILPSDRYSPNFVITKHREQD